MGTRHDPDGRRTDDCTTTKSFSDHGVGDGETLIRQTYYRLVEGGTADFAPTDEVFDRVETAFVWSYLAATDERGVPPHVEAAIEDARTRTREAFDDDPDADLRTDVLPAFYQRVAGFHCIYRRDRS